MGLDIAGVGALADFANTVVSRIWPDKTQVEKDALAKEIMLATQEHELIKGQQDINKEEAKSPNLFIAGWRPAAGWLAVTGLAYSTVLEPAMRFIAVVIFGYTGSFPILETGLLISLLVQLLGIGGLRTFEKFNGVEHKR